MGRKRESKSCQGAGDTRGLQDRLGTVGRMATTAEGVLFPASSSPKSQLQDVGFTYPYKPNLGGGLLYRGRGSGRVHNQGPTPLSGQFVD
jgi:hypothetical protein